MNVYKSISEIPQFTKAVITIGSFDGVHAGHQKILQRVKNIANEIGGESIIITFYPHPRFIVDNSTSQLQVLNTLDEKLFLFEKNGIKNVVVIPFSFEFSRQDPREYVEKFIIGLFKPEFVVIGYDHRFGLNRSGDISLLRDYEKQGHFTVVEIPAHEIEEITISSSRIRKCILNGDINDANEYLNSYYLLSGKVIHGDKLGTKLGYPTANLLIAEKDKLIPREGVYAVKVLLGEDCFEGMMYIGKRPTIQNQDHINIEINIFEFNENLYDKFIRIEILSYLRGDIKFGSIDDLKSQLHIDEKNAQIALKQFDVNKKTQATATIAILNFNGEEMLEAYLPMLEYSSSKFSIDIVVIDNNSTDNSIAYVKEWHPEIKTIELTQNYGYAGGYNKGLENIDTDYIAFINSDVLVTENWIDPIIKLLEDRKEVAIVQPSIISLENKDYYEYAGASGGFIDYLGYPFCRGRIFDTVEKNEGQYQERCEIFWASGAAFVMRTKLFKTIGGFDAGFFAHQEEIDLAWRIKAAGYKVFVEPSSVVYHLGGGTLEYQSPSKTYLNFRNNLYLITKNERLIKLLWLIPFKLLLDFVAGVKFLFSGQPNNTFAIVKAHIHYYINLPSVIEQRNKDEVAIQAAKIGQRNKNGKVFFSIIIKYFIEGKKKFSQLPIPLNGEK